MSVLLKNHTMKNFILLFSFVAVLLSCSAPKNYLVRADADKALQDAVKKLNRNSSDEEAMHALPVLYTNISNTHLERIKAFSNSNELSRWDKIINEYQYLENAYEAIINSSPSFKLINPVSYSTQILEAKQTAADEYYTAAQTFFEAAGRDNAKKAYTCFKKADQFIPGFRDVPDLMNRAYENAIINVLINPVQDNSFFFNSGWGNYGYNYSNEYFQQALVRELSSNSNRYPARFYTDLEARRDNINPDWIIDLRLRNMDIPYPFTNNYSRNVSARVQSGTDTSGKAVYTTVYATMNISRMSFTARADMEVNVRDRVTGKSISYRSFREDYRWEQERAGYMGDNRALSGRDWQMINNPDFYAPRKEDVLNELYRKIYPQVKNNISNTVDW